MVLRYFVDTQSLSTAQVWELRNNISGNVFVVNISANTEFLDVILNPEQSLEDLILAFPMLKSLPIRPGTEM